MKKLASLLLVVMLLVLPVSSMSETAEEAAEDSGSFFDALRSWYYDSGAAEFNEGVFEFFKNGAIIAGETMKQYVQMAEDYLREIYPDWDEETQKAWDTITAAAQDISAATKEEVNEAWAVIKNWMQETGETMSEGTRAIFNAIGSAAGVEEARQELETMVGENTDAE